MIDTDISINNSKQEFSNIGIENPKLINEEISHQKQKFSKLKFQYLEQETRDKFLRIILNNSLTITKDDIDRIVQENEQVKSKLKGLKNETTSKQEEISTLTGEINELNQEFELENDNYNNAMKQIQQMEWEIKDIGVDNELVENIDFNKFDNLDSYITKEQQELHHESRKLDELQETIDLTTKLNDNKVSLIHQLNDKLLQINLIKPSAPVENNSYNNLGKWYNEVNRLLMTLVQQDTLKFNIIINEKFIIQINDVELALNRHNLSIEESQNTPVINEAISHYNHSNNKSDILGNLLLQIIPLTK